LRIATPDHPSLSTSSSSHQTLRSIQWGVSVVVGEPCVGGDMFQKRYENQFLMEIGAHISTGTTFYTYYCTGVLVYRPYTKKASYCIIVEYYITGSKIVLEYRIHTYSSGVGQE
jgi:hypothetical protein